MALGEQLKVIFLLNNTEWCSQWFCIQCSELRITQNMCSYLLYLFISTFHWNSALCTMHCAHEKKKIKPLHFWKVYLSSTSLSLFSVSSVRLTYFSVQYLYELPYHLLSQRQLNWIYFEVKISFFWGKSYLFNIQHFDVSVPFGKKNTEKTVKIPLCLIILGAKI